MLGKKAIQSVNNRLLALILIAALAAGVIVPAGGKVSAAASGTEAVSTTSSEGSSVRQFNHLELKATMDASQTILPDGAPHIANAKIYNDWIEFGFTEELVTDPYFHFQNGHFIVTVNGEPAETLLVAPTQTNDRVLIQLKNRVMNTDVVTIRFDPGSGTPVKNQAGYPLGTEEIIVTNTSSGLFQVPPEARWPNKTGYDLKAGDPIVTFTPSRSGTNNIKIAFPNEPGNETILSNGNIAKTDFKIRGGSASMQPRAVVLYSDNIQLYLPFGETLTGGVSYTLEMSETAGGNEIRLPSIETMASTAYLAARLDDEVYDEYTFSNLAFSANVPPVVKRDLSVILEEGGDGVSYSAGDLATDLDGDELALSGAASSDNGVAEAVIDADGLLRIDPGSPGNTNVSVEVEDEDSHRITATIAVTVTRPKTPALLSEDIQIKNNSSGADVVTVQAVPPLAVVKVYDAPTGGNLIGTATQGAATGDLNVSIAAGIPVTKIYVTVQNIAGNLLESVRTEAIVPAIVDKSLLEFWIDRAQEKADNAVEGELIGLYEEGSIAELQIAIDAAVAVRDDPDATQDQVDPLISMMIDAVNAFDSRKNVADISVLTAKIDEARMKYFTSTEGDLIGQYEAGAKANLMAAAFSAFQISIKENVTQEEVDEATVAMTAAIAEFDGKKIGAALLALLASAQAKHDAATEGTDNGQYPAGAKALLQTAIDDAWLVADDAAATKMQVDAAVAVLNEAVTAFEAKKISGVVVVNKSVLTDAISVAQATYGGAVEGTANGQYPIGSKTILHSAIRAATTVVNDTAATQVDVDAAVVTLDAAVTAFEAKRIVIRPSVGGGGGGGASAQQSTVQLTVESGGVILGKLPLIRTTNGNGRAIDRLELKKEQLTEWVERLKPSGKFRLEIPDDKDIVDEFNVTIPLEVVQLLVDSNLAFNLKMNGVDIHIPVKSLRGIKEAIKLKINPIREKSEQDRIGERADTNSVVRAASGQGSLRGAGTPISIETNLQNRLVTLTLPGGTEKLSEQQEQNTGIYVEHGDGTRELILPRKVSSGWEFDVTKFSTFAVVRIEGWQQFRGAKANDYGLPYIKGYAGGMFKPGAGITRAELAAILAKVIQGEATKSALTFKDIPDKMWAKEAIDKVAKLGLMKGSPDGGFNPDKLITRAEMAIIAATILGDGTASGEGGFRDVAAGHWAEAAIRKASAAGILTGFKDDTFRPSQTLSRAEAVVMINRLIGIKPNTAGEPLYKDVPATHWAYGAIQAAARQHPAQP
ncbi:S-layer homology domain-containing protein [Cohnella cholangitidis]|uniref:SLH domain-containing protein n=1 Tax=Cohnella cholangitidis TaxID=2598458 RepID=A0A7G5C086_9BACL|nr:S-layer homology domain-containing protein [Cohnella cholangitidis]QMV42620.1 hypothetical protein FPL14_16565 [Cohnella cholangitidis]